MIAENCTRNSIPERLAVKEEGFYQELPVVDLAYSLIDYGEADGGLKHHWLNNGKISDISCAFLIDRLEQHAIWAPRYAEAAEMVTEVAEAAGFRPLMPGDISRPAMSRAFISPRALSLTEIRTSSHVTFGKYYRPLALLQRTERLYDRLINIPTHPGMLALQDGKLAEDLDRFAGQVA